MRLRGELIEERRGRHWRRSLLASLAALVVLALPGPAFAAPGDIGYQGPATNGSNPTGEKPESKLWFNDGLWWASFWDSTSGRYEIFRLDWASQTWSSTDVALDPRSGTHADVLWDGSKLYVASHPYTTSPSAGAADASRLYRFSYDVATDTYTPDAGFPVTINGFNLETLVIDKDSLGRLWATWVEGGDVWVSHTDGNDTNWGVPFVLPTTGASNVTSDDISSLIAMDGKIGVMYSNQNDDTMHFAVHVDSDPDTTWSHEAALGSPGSNLADDHINLKYSQGIVFAATKTSKSGASDPSVTLLVRGTAGIWSSYTFGTKADDHTRPIVLVDESSSVVYVIAAGKSTTTSHDAVFLKSSPIGTVSFPSGDGTQFIDPVGDTPRVNNPTSTKQNLNDSTELVVAASGGGFYWHNSLELGPPPSGPPVNTTPPSITGSPEEGQTLTINEGTWTGALPITYTYEWERCTPGCSPIAGATAETYVLGVDDVGATVRAVVTAENAEGVTPDSTPAVGPVTPAPSVLTFAPIADAHVRSTSPTVNYGSNSSLRVRSGSPDYDAYVKFEVTGLTGPVQSAVLRLYVTDASTDGGSFYSVSNFLRNTSTPWTDSNITWDNAPTLAGPVVATAGSTTVGTWEELDVTSVVTGNGAYSFGFSSASTNSNYYGSKESVNAPELVVTVASGPDGTPPTVTDRSPADGATDVAVGANVTATFSEDVQGVDGTTFTLTGPGNTAIPATVAYSSATDLATLDPSSPLDPGTTYTATLTGGPSAIRDLADNPLATTSWTFTTGAAPSGQIALNGSAITASVTTGSSVVLPAWSPDFNDLILVQVSQRDESSAVTVSGNCPVWHQVADLDNIQGQGGVALYWAQCAAPTAGSITVSVAGNTLPISVIAQRFSGVDPTSPIEAVSTHPGPLVDDANMLTSVTTATANGWVVGAGWHRSKTFVLPTGETAILTNQAAGSGGDTTQASMWYEGPVSSPGSVQLGAPGDLSDASDWGMVAVSLRPAP